MSQKKPIFIRNQEGLPIGCVLENHISLLPSGYWELEDEITIEDCENILASGECTIAISGNNPHTARYLIATLGYMSCDVAFDRKLVLEAFKESDVRIRRSFELDEQHDRESREQWRLLMTYYAGGSSQDLFLIQTESGWFLRVTEDLLFEDIYAYGGALDYGEESDMPISSNLALELYRTEISNDWSKLGETLVEVMSPGKLEIYCIYWGREPAKIPWHEILFALRDDKEYHPVYHELIAYLEEKKLYSENELKKYRGYRKI